MIRINIDTKACKENQRRAASGEREFSPCVLVRRGDYDLELVHGATIHGPCRVVARVEGSTFTVRVETEGEVTCDDQP